MFNEESEMLIRKWLLRKIGQPPVKKITSSTLKEKKIRPYRNTYLPDIIDEKVGKKYGILASFLKTWIEPARKAVKEEEDTNRMKIESWKKLTWLQAS